MIILKHMVIKFDMKDIQPVRKSHEFMLELLRGMAFFWSRSYCERALYFETKFEFLIHNQQSGPKLRIYYFICFSTLCMKSILLIHVLHQSKVEQKIQELKQVNLPLSLQCETFISMLGNLLLYAVG